MLTPLYFGPIAAGQLAFDAAIDDPRGDVCSASMSFAWLSREFRSRYLALGRLRNPSSQPRCSGRRARHEVPPVQQVSPLQHMAFSLSKSSHVRECLRDSIPNFIRRHVGDCEPNELENGERANWEHFRLRIWRRIDLESPAVGNVN
jgi:hypothetical protein